MGCNIHAFIEKKPRNKTTEEWTLAEEPPFERVEEPNGAIWYDSHRDRNYALYSYLADVRNYSEKSLAIVQPRGIPTDASKLYNLIVQKYGIDGHSHSYLYLYELAKIPWDIILDKGTPFEETLRYYSKPFINEILKPMQRLNQHNHVRVVFFFDN